MEDVIETNQKETEAHKKKKNRKEGNGKTPADANYVRGNRLAAQRWRAGKQPGYLKKNWGETWKSMLKRNNGKYQPEHNAWWRCSPGSCLPGNHRLTGKGCCPPKLRAGLDSPACGFYEGFRWSTGEVYVSLAAKRGVVGVALRLPVPRIGRARRRQNA